MVTKFFGLHASDIKRAYLMFGYIFTVIATVLVLKPLRNSLFLTELGADKLPTAFILVSLSSLIAIGFYTKFSNRISLGRLISLSQGVFIIVLGICWLLLHFNLSSDTFVYLFYSHFPLEKLEAST